MIKGIVKWFNNPMKYGFVVSEDGKEYFVHFSEIMTEGYKTLKRGEAVQFEAEETPKGNKAVHVERLAAAEHVKHGEKPDSSKFRDKYRRSA